MKSYQYRIYPTKKQARTLSNMLEECRWLYNYFLEQRNNEWSNNQKSLSLYDQIGQLSALKKEHIELKQVHSQVLQNVAVRVDLAFKGFFRRLKANQKAGYPRFKGKYRYDSITYPQFGNGCQISNNQELVLSKIGKIKIKLHRDIIGSPKTINIKRSATGKWYATISCETELNILSELNNSVGIDVGLETFATFSDGKKLPPPKFFRKEEKSLVKAQRKHSKSKTNKTRKVVARVHERIKNKRNDFTHQLSRNIVNSYQIICVEDLSVNDMLKNHCLAKSIQDASWTDFLNKLFVKAVEAGRTIVKVNPAYTSQDCSQCGYRVKKKLSDRIHNCPNCGLSIDRDINASINILRVGTYSLANA